ncbi:MAG: hypothetical protein AB1641_29880 [Thermodesulfobacteriota bacterium]
MTALAKLNDLGITARLTEVGRLKITGLARLNREQAEEVVRLAKQHKAEIVAALTAPTPDTAGTPEPQEPPPAWRFTRDPELHPGDCGRCHLRFVINLKPRCLWAGFPRSLDPARCPLLDPGRNKLFDFPFEV